MVDTRCAERLGNPRLFSALVGPKRQAFRPAWHAERLRPGRRDPNDSQFLAIDQSVVPQTKSAAFKKQLGARVGHSDRELGPP
jgi:hypothetical protein